MKQEHQFMLTMTFGALTGFGLGGLVTSQIVLGEQERIYAKDRVRIASKDHGDKKLKTFQTPNGEISYLVENTAETAINEIIFYMERARDTPITLKELMAIYRVADYNYDNRIFLQETTPLLTELREKYVTQAWKELKK